MAHVFLVAFVATCFFASASYKFRNQTAFREAIDEFAALQRLPRVVRRGLARTIPLAELAVAVLLAVPRTSQLGAFSALGFAAAFVVVVALDPRETIAHCGCWGVASPDIPKGFYLGRSVLLLCAAISTAVLGVPHSSLSLYLEAFALTAPFALLLLDLPQIGQIVRIQRLANGGGV